MSFHLSDAKPEKKRKPKRRRQPRPEKAKTYADVVNRMLKKETPK